jgi:hypothetical protein
VGQHRECGSLAFVIADEDPDHEPALRWRVVETRACG